MKRRSARSKIYSAAQLQAQISRKRRGKTVVFTNGCFDLLHKGHVTYLEKARNLGDVLVVALNSDASVKRLKGQSRPLNSLLDRSLVIASLESVDFVTSFGSDTPLELIRKLKPDVLVKGGDWKPDQIVGSEEVLKNGGKVKSISFVPGRSTTRLIKKMKKKSS